ncbi:hypothetical protein Pla22_12380 [Rubripirellula amarantea]|uniref:Protein MtfA n=1 Tax=Rubripirellula amarantea TaxID=2527999 RepID=A0A5C5WSX4_9BACT|nr:zinc-dependent peptidase [Rubripirellula amarantea]TWT53608.1 hypothetical protein Pla22_12380 [Rubripirellula amarantea]
MLITPELDRRNRLLSFLFAGLAAIIGIGLAWISPWWILLALASPAIYVLARRNTKRRIRVASQPFPPAWRSALERHVQFYVALPKPDKRRFESLMQIFVDEVAITGIRTDVDDQTISLVAASAVIPIFGFEYWEYAGLGEVLIYPNRFGENFESSHPDTDHVLGMVGAGHLSGVMILSKPDLVAGFDISNDKRNVGIHEFSHLIDKADGSIDGIPATIPRDVVRPWIEWVGNELRSDATKLAPKRRHIDDYAFTNEAEYFAVLSEYFFESPSVLAAKAPQLYQMLEKIYRQDTRQRFRQVRRRRIGRNTPCPCGSGEKFKRCCRV